MHAVTRFLDHHPVLHGAVDAFGLLLTASALAALLAVAGAVAALAGSAAARRARRGLRALADWLEAGGNPVLRTYLLTLVPSGGALVAEPLAPQAGQLEGRVYDAALDRLRCPACASSLDLRPWRELVADATVASGEGGVPWLTSASCPVCRADVRLPPAALLPPTANPHGEPGQ